MQKVHLYVFSHMVFLRKRHKVWIYKMKMPFEVPEKKQICVSLIQMLNVKWRVPGEEWQGLFIYKVKVDMHQVLIAIYGTKMGLPTLEL